MNDFLEKLIIPSPVLKVDHPLLKSMGVQLSVKRDDLIHPYVSGNKWRKLKYNLLHAKTEGIQKIVTFGGAFSNHIHATAAASQAFHLDSVGIIRGEEDKDNPTLQFARSCGMKIIFTDRASYRLKEQSETIQSILHKLGPHFLVPEGGSNEWAIPGLKELTEEINATDHNKILVSAGTGGTASGILKYLNPDKELWVFSSLKGDFLKEDILTKAGREKINQLKFIGDYHFGGYGKVPKELVLFINRFKDITGIPIDPIYNGKLVAGFFDLLKKRNIDHSKSYLWVHTGGLQGVKAYNYMAKRKGQSALT